MSDFTETGWAVALLMELGFAPRPDAVRGIVAWEKAEGGHWHNTAKFNPLNTTQPMPGAGNTGTQGNIKVYTGWKQGLDATVKTLRNGHYPDVLNALKKGSANDIANAVGSSPWGTSGSLIQSTLRGTSISSDAYIKGVEQQRSGLNALPHDIIPAIGKAGDAVLSNPLDFAKSIWNHIGVIFTEKFWLSVLKIVAGGVAIVLGLLLAFKEFEGTAIKGAVGGLTK